MKCPKCNSAMVSHSLETNAGTVTVDQCSRCKGIWFDSGEAEILKEEWRSLFLDTGDPKIGAEFDKQREADCPRCSTKMVSVHDKKQHHIVYEVCGEHGIFMDAGEFTDLKYETVLDLFRDVVSRVRA